ncbi:hypothetical protein KC887_05985 [Candidatus Kaiserbacteria bacterium]|nr:hypothetical protein [Candidatus Kaiserbacteria bacterium]
MSGLSPEQIAERENRRQRLMASRMVSEGSFTASDAAHLLSNSKRKQYLSRDQGRNICDWLVEQGDLQSVKEGRSRHYFKPRTKHSWPAPPDNGIPLGRYYP